MAYVMRQDPPLPQENPKAVNYIANSLFEGFLTESTAEQTRTRARNQKWAYLYLGFSFFFAVFALVIYPLLTLPDTPDPNAPRPAPPAQTAPAQFPPPATVTPLPPTSRMIDDEFRIGIHTWV